MVATERDKTHTCSGVDAAAAIARSFIFGEVIRVYIKERKGGKKKGALVVRSAKSSMRRSRLSLYDF
jgi:hypothetical protein